MTTSRAVIQIPQVYSQPAESGATSFLTLIPEIRNSIYELLLRSTYGVLVQHPYDEADEDLREEFPETAHIEQGISILSACWQTYHEAVGILYGQNTFCIARSASFAATKPNMPTVVVCAEWLESTGSNLPSVRKVIAILDDHVKYHTFGGTDFILRGNIYLYPMMRVLWIARLNTLDVQVKLRKLKGTLATVASKNECLPVIAVARTLDQVIRMLGIEDILDLRRYRTLVCEISVRQDG